MAYTGWVTHSSGFEIPDPAFDSGNVTISTLVNAGRIASGKFVGQVIGYDKMKIEMNWSVLEPDQMQRLLALFDKRQGGRFVNTFTVFNPATGRYETKRMYVGDRSGKPLMVDNGQPTYWGDVTADLIEV